eukprot:scaffold198313_cov35-Attheya_sp.AAC.1
MSNQQKGWETEGMGHEGGLGLDVRVCGLGVAFNGPGAVSDAGTMTGFAPVCLEGGFIVERY